ncbi:MAG TPA: ABC transporter permease [Terriglobia bacterium]|nr:ABC transporter permease [Terriglobia bacterium]
MNRFAWLDILRRDALYGLRVLSRTPGWTISAVLTLALCIGANTAIFSVVDAVLLRPLPYPEPGRLIQVGRLAQTKDGQSLDFGHDGKTWFALKQKTEVIDAAIYTETSSAANFTAAGTVETLQQQRVSSGYFRVLGIPLAIGREFAEEEDRVGGSAVAVLSYGLWQRAFQGDSSIIGKDIHLRGEPHTVIGVSAFEFRSTVRADVWTPVRPSTTGEGGGRNYEIIARLRPGVSFAQADSHVQSVGRDLVADMHLSPGVSVDFRVVSLQRGLTDDLRQTLSILWMAVGLVLLIGCLNIASLLLARNAGRSREIATRIAIGGGRAAVVHQLLVESLLIGIGGAIAGTAVGYAGIRTFGRLAPEVLNVWQEIGLDTRVLGLTIAMSFLASILFGLIPALQSTRLDIRSGLADGGGRTVAGTRKKNLRRVLVLSQISIAVVLVINATLLIRTFNHFLGLKPGFDGSNLVAAKFSLQDARYNSAANVRMLIDAGLARIRELPGVEAAAAGLCLPYERPLNSGVRVDGGQPKFTNFCYATPEYFKTLRIPLLAGREFTSADQTESEPVVIVNETFVRKYLSGRDPVGAQVNIGKPAMIIGIVGSVPFRAGFDNYEPLDSTPSLFVPVTQPPDAFFRMAHTWFSPAWIVRTVGYQQGFIVSLQQAMRTIDPMLPIAGIYTIDDLITRSLAPQRFDAELMGLMAGLALILALVGVYGLIANSVVERTREIGIRLALGATPETAIRTVASEGIILAVVGAGIGCVVARFTSRFLQGLVFGLSTTDAITFFEVAMGLIVIASAASMIPALRIVTINPVTTLKSE